LTQKNGARAFELDRLKHCGKGEGKRRTAGAWGMNGGGAAQQDNYNYCGGGLLVRLNGSGGRKESFNNEGGGKPLT